MPGAIIILVSYSFQKCFSKLYHQVGVTRHETGSLFQMLVNTFMKYLVSLLYFSINL